MLNKLVATLAPAGGLTLLAQFQNLMALLTALPNDGVHVGLVKYLAPLVPGSARYRAWLGAATLLNLAGLVAGGALLASRGLLGWGWGSLGLFLLGITLVTGQGLLGAALLAAGRLRACIGLSVGVALLGTAGAATALRCAGPCRGCCSRTCWPKASRCCQHWGWRTGPVYCGGCVGWGR